MITPAATRPASRPKRAPWNIVLLSIIRKLAHSLKRSFCGLLLRITSIALPAMLTGGLLPTPACMFLGPPVLGSELIDQDYYFTGSYVQIQGEADLPSIRAARSNPGAEASAGTTVEFLSLRERRKICRARALQHSHTKWLSLTRRDRQPQVEWDLRLRMGGSGAWQQCLDRAIVRNHFYDEPGRCRVVVLYPCLPQRY